MLHSLRSNTTTNFRPAARAYSQRYHLLFVQLVFYWAPKLARKCESKHWFPCGADGRSYGHVITKFSRMGRLPHTLRSAMIHLKYFQVHTVFTKIPVNKTFVCPLTVSERMFFRHRNAFSCHTAVLTWRLLFLRSASIVTKKRKIYKSMSLVLQKGKIPLVRLDYISENYANVCIQTQHERILIYTTDANLYRLYLAWIRSSHCLIDYDPEN